MNRSRSLLAASSLACCSTAVMLVSGTAHAQTSFGGLTVQPANGTHIAHVPVGLRVSNLSPSGPSGVSVLMPTDSATSRDLWGAMLGSPAIGSGASMEFVSWGRMAGGGEAPAGRMTLDYSGAAPVCSLDFSGLGSVTLSAQYFSGGTLVYEETGIVASSASFNLSPVLPDLGWSAHWQKVGQFYVLKFDGTHSTERSIGGADIPLSDSWIISAEGGTTPFEDLSRVDVLATGLSEFTITSMAYAPAPGAAALLGLGGLLAARRRRSE